MVAGGAGFGAVVRGGVFVGGGLYHRTGTAQLAPQCLGGRHQCVHHGVCSGPDCWVHGGRLDRRWPGRPGARARRRRRRRRARPEPGRRPEVVRGQDRGEEGRDYERVAH